MPLSLADSCWISAKAMMNGNDSDRNDGGDHEEYISDHKLQTEQSANEDNAQTEPVVQEIEVVIQDGSDERLCDRWGSWKYE